MAEALLGRRLRDREPAVAIESAGRLPGGYPMTPEGLEVMRDFGLDLAGHQSRTATSAQVARADLVLGMTREHVRDAAELVPEALPTSFTLKELVRRGDALGPRRPDEPLAAWLGRAVAGRQPADLLGSAKEDDVADPMGRPIRRYRQVAGEIDAATERLVDLAWPEATGSG
jgi:protein-tyrosine phosphatase